MVESNERSRVEGHSLVRYTCLYHRKNQAGNLNMEREKKSEENLSKTIAFF
jgi:hypothetical protein